MIEETNQISDGSESGSSSDTEDDTPEVDVQGPTKVAQGDQDETSLVEVEKMPLTKKQRKQGGNDADGDNLRKRRKRR